MSSLQAFVTRTMCGWLRNMFCVQDVVHMPAGEPLGGYELRLLNELGDEVGVSGGKLFVEVGDKRAKAMSGYNLGPYVNAPTRDPPTVVVRAEWKYGGESRATASLRARNPVSTQYVVIAAQKRGSMSPHSM